MMIRGFHYMFAPVQHKSYFSFKGAEPAPEQGAGDRHLGLEEFKGILKAWEAERVDLNTQFLKAAPWATSKTLADLHEVCGINIRTALTIRLSCLERENPETFSEMLQYMKEKRWQTRNNILGAQEKRSLYICSEIISPMNKAYVLVFLLKMADLLRPAMQDIEKALDAAPKNDLTWQHNAVKGFIECSRAVCDMVLQFSPERAERLNQIILAKGYEGIDDYVAAFKASHLTLDHNVFPDVCPRPPRLPRPRAVKEL